jgi:hypothetical protein
VPRLAAAVIAAAGLAMGCGGDERKEAVGAAESWLKAVAERDADAACELMRESAVDTIREKSALNEKTTCVGAVRAYADAFAPGDIDGILKIGFEANGPVKDDELGVFPRSGSRTLQVVLMRREDGEWKVASMTLGPTDPGVPDTRSTPTPTPESG